MLPFIAHIVYNSGLFVVVVMTDEVPEKRQIIGGGMILLQND